MDPSVRSTLGRPATATALLGLTLLGACSRPNLAPPVDRPNFVFVLCDDLGWKDVGYNGSASYKTPNIDRLAASGMVFRSAYAAAPSCSPTRAAILTGKHPARLGLTKAIRLSEYSAFDTGEERERPNARHLQAESLNALPPEETTIADRLAEAGYRTCFIGKWHLGDGLSQPMTLGFTDARAVGLFPASNYFPPYHVSDAEDAEADEYLTDRLTDEAVAFLRDAGDTPFLLYLSHFAVHAPWEAPEGLVEEYAATLDPNAPQGNATYAAMVHSLDDGVGRVLDELDRLEMTGRTVVVFTSDNGGTEEKRRHGELLFRVTSNAPLRSGKLSLHEGGLRVPAIVRIPWLTEPGSVSDVPMISMDYYPTLLSLAGISSEDDEPRDGVDLAPLLSGSSGWMRDELFFHVPHRDFSSAVLRDSWKLIRYFEGGTELYDLSKDLGEADDRSAAEPDRVRELGDALDRWLADTGAKLPVPNPAYRPREDS